MGSPLRAGGARPPWRAGGSLWKWAASRLPHDWTARFSAEDQETMVLTQCDELNTTYSQDRGAPFHSLTGEDSAWVTPSSEGPQTPAPDLVASTSAQRLKNLKGSRVILTSTGAQTSSVTPTDGSIHCHATQRRPDVRPGASRGPEERRSSGGTCTCSKPAPTITAWEAAWNVTNAIQGIFVLGLPFALAQSGYPGLVLLVLSAWVCNHTGAILVSCLYEEHAEPSRVRVRTSYRDIVEACCEGLLPPGLGGLMVNIAQVVELLMTCTLYLLVSTSLLSDSLSALAVPRSACSLVALLFLLPCLLLTDLRPVSTLSLLCSMAHILISLLVIVFCLSRASVWSWSFLSVSVDPENFLVSAGVIIFSYTSQIFLPTLEGSMEDRGHFSAMLSCTHAAACVLKTSFSLLAVLTWGSQTSEVITDNLPSELRALVTLCLLAKALLSYPLPFYSAAELLQSSLLGGERLNHLPQHGGSSRWMPLLRAALLATTYLLACVVPRFSLLMGLTGSVTGSAMTLILPCLCHLRLQWRLLSGRQRLVDACILSLGVVCSVSGVMCSVRRLAGEL
ncbi:vesicular inhibitory amino acid transporter-like [Synchiropus splendidus]|uniref:vesicular inhibitory amino acid transporter-like n=1 Tax=Synchiropus splendidus TaxID=270530 RepID=UPI00237EAF0C|nr:vesicular inhibitory amino acid transporter-like [Synchiropus splendidus]